MSLSRDVLKETVESYLANNGNISRISKALGLARTTVRDRIAKAKRLGMLDRVEPDSGCLGDVNDCQTNMLLHNQISDLKRELREARRKALDILEVRKFIHEIRARDPQPPEWLTAGTAASSGVIGVPSLALSDFHWSEVVDPAQVFYANEYNLEVAARRLRRLMDRTVDVLTKHMTSTNYPGIVINMLGDMFSGNIHDELRVTNAGTLLQSILDLYGHMIAFIGNMADVFGRVFIPCVSGNHGRLTKRIQAKNFAYENVDWHLYCLLAKHFEGDARIRFVVSDAEDLQYRIYRWDYRLTHGCQFRGGDGIIGALGPVTRGDVKKRAQATNLGNYYTTLVFGHFHRYLPIGSIIGNGSLVGFSEYAMRENFPFEPPRQALWITHPVRGITFHVPIQVDEPKTDGEGAEWVAWQK